MPAEWKTLTILDAGVSLIDCEHRTPPAAIAGFPYVAIPQLKAGRLDLSNARQISPEHFRDWTRKARPQTDDVILSRRCNPGETAFVPPGLQCALGQNLVLLRADGTKIYPPFLRWLVRGEEWWEQIRKFLNSGAVFDSLKCADIPQFRLAIPPLKEQEAIAAALGVLDQKIELNRRMNETLEAIGQAIFKSWFVDFDPVRAKARRGNRPGIAANFPAEFSASRIGLVPRGWGVGPITSRARLLSGGTPKTSRKDYWNGDILWCSAKDVSQAAETVLLATERTITEKGLHESATQLVPRWCTVVIARGATTGRMVLLGKEMAMNQTCYALQSSIGAPLSLYCQLRVEMGGLVHAAHGSVFDTITTTTFANSLVILPPEPLLLAFENRVKPLFDRILSNADESRTLVALRETLLPKLVSGQIGFNQAEKIIEANA
jgi:type I restriction enzyme S subunit